jgi:hypothetical protein
MDKNINWNSVIKKEARGINDDDLGEVQSIGPNYVTTMKGVARKKTFYIPKYLVEGYDWHNVWFRISKQELNDKFMRDKPPTIEEYHQYRTGAISQNTSSSGGLESITVSSDIENRVPMVERKGSNIDEEPAVLDWENIVHKNVRTKDNEPLGNVVAVTNGSVVVTSIGARDEYYIPRSYVQRFDGAEVFLKLPLAAADGYKI